MAALLAVAAVTVLVRAVWPVTAEPGLRATLDTLRGSPVPVWVILPQVSREIRTEVRPDGYVFTIVRPDLGDLTLWGTRGDPGPPAADEYRWTEGSVTYGVLAVPDVRNGRGEQLRRSAVPLTAALRDRWGFLQDTPLLYGVYLPALVLLGGWAAWSLLAERPGSDEKA